jgi:hypothetical protein
MVLPRESSAIEVTSVKSVQGGFKNNPQNGTGRNVWTCAITFWVGIMRKEMPFSVVLSLVAKH